MSDIIKLQDIANKVHFTHENTKKLIDIFYTSSNTILENMLIAIKEKDFDGIYRQAHSLKGSSSNLLFTSVAQIAREIEDAAANKKEYNYEEHVINIKDILKRTQII